MIDELFYDATDLLKQMISVPSVSRNESKVSVLICRHLDQYGLTYKLIGNNIVAGLDRIDTAKPTLMLNSHMDTVPPTDGWTRDPFTPGYDPAADRLYGLGSNDAGASAVSLIAVYRLLATTPQPYNLLLVISAEEEVSGRDGMERVVRELPVDVDFAVVGEPTGMRPAIAEKGLMVLDGEVDGVAGHAARDEGVNAIYRALPVIERLRSLTFDNVSPTLGPVKISVTQIEAGTKHNVVPDLCRFVADVRTTDAYTNAETLELIRAAAPEARLTPRSTRLNPSGIPAGHPIVSRAAMMGLEPYGSPTLSDQALMPWPSVKMGPGDSARSHTADEYIVTAEIRHAIDTYYRLLNQLNIN